MPGHIHDTTTSRLARPWRVHAIFVACLCVSSLAFGKPGGEPLVLDTQTGIHSGVPGTVLQSGTLGGPGMVQMETLPGPPQQEQPPIIVSPYIEYPSGQGTTTSGANGGRYRNPRSPSY